ncbi:MAG TPA: quinoprotein dehydrogenase-associated SoxYZ-like carrier [Burkholderiales bacterium]|nr:quinoprotein dehydrogenase-associated SoxYZ-like carrier [Burkholderiales bacterium]
MLLSLKRLSRVFLCAALACCLVQPAAPANDLPNPETEIWGKVKRSLFEGRTVSNDARGVVELVAPVRAEDAAVVPIAIRAKLEQRPERYIRRIYLIVDNNPSPIAATFELTPESGRAELETRIRIEEYTYVRAVAELSDGKLVADSRYVKAAGGCSAPAGKDPAAAAARIGRMRLAVEDNVSWNRPALAQLMISHPNDSGLVMDQVTRHYTPAYFVRSIRVTYAGRPILTADVDFSISENPNFRFYFVPSGEGELKAEAVDTKELKFETRLAVRRGARVAGKS